MKAMIVRAYGGPEALRLEAVDKPRPAAGEVLVMVRAVTVNRTRDLNVVAGQAGGPDALPLIPGQDPAGEIVEVGEGVDNARRGERVIVSSRMICGQCDYCRSGRGSDCPKSRHIGIHRAGGYAEYVAVPAEQAVPIADSLGFAEAAVAMRHFPMAYQQLRGKVEVKPGEWVLVMGASGGLGSACIQVAKLMGAKVIAGAGGDERVAAGMALGADYGVNYRTEDLTKRVREITGGRGVDAICENISDPTTFPAAFASLAMMGRLVTAGAHGGGTVPVNMKQLYQSRQRILGSAGHDPLDIVMAMEGAGSGKLKAKVDLVMPLDKLHDAFALIHDRKVAGKIVIDPRA
jgi:D-arabinose 1-dehydrogenase-like Zn-dependent alcohol dehydrogenase